MNPSGRRLIPPIPIKPLAQRENQRHQWIPHGVRRKTPQPIWDFVTVTVERRRHWGCFMARTSSFWGKGSHHHDPLHVRNKTHISFPSPETSPPITTLGGDFRLPFRRAHLEARRCVSGWLFSPLLESEVVLLSDCTVYVGSGFFPFKTLLVSSTAIWAMSLFSCCVLQWG